MAHVTVASNVNGGTLTITPPGNGGAVGPQHVRIYSASVSVLNGAATTRLILLQIGNATGPGSNGAGTAAIMYHTFASADGGSGVFHYNPAVPLLLSPGAVNIIYAATNATGTIINTNGNVIVTVVYDFV